MAAREMQRCSVFRDPGLRRSSVGTAPLGERLSVTSDKTPFLAGAGARLIAISDFDVFLPASGFSAPAGLKIDFGGGANKVGHRYLNNAAARLPLVPIDANPRLTLAPTIPTRILVLSAITLPRKTIGSQSSTC